MAFSLLCFWLATILFSVAGAANATQPPPEPAKVLTEAMFRSEVAVLRDQVAACSHNAAFCQASAIPDQQSVSGTISRPGFTVRWEWLHTAMNTAQKASAATRLSTMRDADRHLSQLTSEAEATGVPEDPAIFGKAKAAANATLAREEFRAATQGPDWFDRQLARLQDTLLRLFFGMGVLGKKAPWLAPFIEWGSFLLLGGGLLWAARRNLQRQTLRIALGEGLPLGSGTERSQSDWERLSEEHAGAGQWREAIHSLYWAAITLLENQRAWKANPTRTPRESLRLLRPGSAAYRELRSLTQALERVWYGSETADQERYTAAQASYRALKTTRPERALEAVAAEARPAPAGAPVGA